MAELLTLRLTQLLLTDEAEAWQGLGFEFIGATVAVGELEIHLDPNALKPEWAFFDPDAVDVGAEFGESLVDGIPTRRSPRCETHRVGHANGIVGVDHLVVTTPDGPRTADALAHLGLELRRRRPTTMAGVEMEQWFYRPGTIIEVVAPREAVGEGSSAIWGITFVTADLDATARRLGSLLSAPRPAVQRGRHIASVRREAGLRTRVAIMDAHRRVDPPGHVEA